MEWLIIGPRAQEVQKTNKQTNKQTPKARGVIIWHRMVTKTYLELKYMV